MDIIEIISTNQDYNKKLRKIIEKGVLDIKSGSATLHFNADGVLASIEINARVYNYSKE